jgi:hypothetical protein
VNPNGARGGGGGGGGDWDWDWDWDWRARAREFNLEVEAGGRGVGAAACVSSTTSAVQHRHSLRARGRPCICVLSLLFHAFQPFHVQLDWSHPFGRNHPTSQTSRNILMLIVEPPAPAQTPAHADQDPKLCSSRALGTRLEHIDVSVPRALLRRCADWSLARWPRQQIIERGSCWRS